MTKLPLMVTTIAALSPQSDSSKVLFAFVNCGVNPSQLTHCHVAATRISQPAFYTCYYFRNSTPQTLRIVVVAKDISVKFSRQLQQENINTHRLTLLNQTTSLSSHRVRCYVAHCHKRPILLMIMGHDGPNG